MRDDFAYLIVFAILSIGFLLLADVTLRVTISYRIKENYLEVLVLRVLPIARVRCGAIVSVAVMSFGCLIRESLRGPLFWAARAGNRLFARRVVVVSRQRQRALIISPRNPDAFAEELRKRCGLS